MATKGTLRTCFKGHQYYKSSDCPTCPTCVKDKKPVDGFLASLSAPARRALEHLGIRTLQQLSKYSEKELLKAHGFGPASLPVLRQALKDAGLGFNK